MKRLPVIITQPVKVSPSDKIDEAPLEVVNEALQKAKEIEIIEVEPNKYMCVSDDWYFPSKEGISLSHWRDFLHIATNNLYLPFKGIIYLRQRTLNGINGLRFLVDIKNKEARPYAKEHLSHISVSHRLPYLVEGITYGIDYISKGACYRNHLYIKNKIVYIKEIQFKIQKG